MENQVVFGALAASAAAVNVALQFISEAVSCEEALRGLWKCRSLKRPRRHRIRLGLGQSRKQRASDYERLAMAPELAPTAPSPCEKSPSPLHADIVIESQIFTKNAHT